MRQIRSTLWFGLALLAVLALGACDCDDNTPPCMCAPADVCTTDEDCSGGLSCADGCCGGCKECLVDSDCEGEDEICQDGECVEQEPCTITCGNDDDCTAACTECIAGCCRSIECATDADCPPEGGLERYCPDEPDPETGCRSCLYVRCTTDEECGDPTFPLFVECTGNQYPRCVRGTCECAQPCGGTCPDGRYCCQVSNTCEPIPEPCPGASCPACEQVNPEPGGTLNEETCAVEGADCSCQPLPPLPDAFAGQHSAVALLPDGLPVLSGYFGQPYGDLIFGRAAAAETGAAVDWSFVDGVPLDAPCEGAADGPRGGIAEPGDDVGWDTDLVVDADGLPRISYYDRTHGTLKYAAFNGAGWDIHVVDADGRVGRYTSMALDSAGRPVIVYMALQSAGQAQLRLAWATSAAPAVDTDWMIAVADSVAVPCHRDECPTGEACLAYNQVCTALDDPANCTGCTADQACVGAQCLDLAEPASSLEDLPPGVGLFASLVLLSDDSPVVAYYDSLAGNLKLVAWDPVASAFGAPLILDGEDGGGNDTGDVGTDVALSVAADGSLHLVYQDADLGQLRYLAGPGATPEIVDLGARDAAGDPTDPASAVGDLHWVGNYASLVIDDLGNLRAAYQDGTSLDLLVAVREPAGTWTPSILARKIEGDGFVGAYGFFTDQVLDATGATVVVSNFKHNLRTDPWQSGIDLRLHTWP